jgi:O-antigen/teichoic acid export membrane protein
MLGFVNTMILVRILVPADFGLLALATSFAQGIDQLAALGIEDAVVREAAPTTAFYDSAFTMNVLRGLGTATIVSAAAWPAANFFHEPRLFPVLLVLAFGAFVAAFQNIGIVDFRRNLAFEKEFILLIAPRMVTILLTATLALLTRSYWALVAGSLTMQILRTGMSYVMHPHRPRLTLRSWRGLIGFSSWSWAISMVSMMRDRVDGFVISRVLGPAQLGIYTIAAEVATIPTFEVAGPLGRATFSSFAAARHTGRSVTELYLRLVASASLVVVPAGFGLSLVAEPVVLLVFGPKWDAATNVIRIIGVAGIALALGSVTSSLLVAQGMLRQTFYICLSATILRVACMILLVKTFGLVGAAVGWAVAISSENLLYGVVVLRHLDLRPATVLRAVWRILAATAVMVLVLATTGLGWTRVAATGLKAVDALVTGVATGAATYVIVLGALWYLCGRPKGAEADMLELGRRMASRIADILAKGWRWALSPR